MNDSSLQNNTSMEPDEPSREATAQPNSAPSTVLRPPKRSGEQIRTWAAFLFGLMGAVLGLLGYLEAQRGSAEARHLKVEGVLSEAWDLMGGQTGSTVVSHFVADQQQLELARRKIREARILMPDYPKVNVYHGAYLEAVGRISDAVESYRQAIILDSQYALAHNHLGAALLKAGQTDEALLSFKRAIELEPNEALYHFNLASAYVDKGEPWNALNHHQTAVVLDPSSALYLVHLGNFLRDPGDWGSAVAAYHQALELNPNYAEAYYNLAVTRFYMGGGGGSYPTMREGRANRRTLRGGMQ